jgi:hypothetical protein
VPQIEDVQTTAPAAADDTLDDYFDKLDEAFATINTSAAAEPFSSQPDARTAHPDGPIRDHDLDSFDAAPVLDVPAVTGADASDPFAGF